MKKLLVAFAFATVALVGSLSITAITGAPVVMADDGDEGLGD